MINTKLYPIDEYILYKTKDNDGVMYHAENTDALSISRRDLDELAERIFQVSKDNAVFHAWICGFNKDTLEDIKDKEPISTEEKNKLLAKYYELGGKHHESINLFRILELKN